MSNEYERLKKFAQYWEGKTVNELFPHWVMRKFPPSNIRQGHCLVCGAYMPPEHIWPDGLTPRCMCDPCYYREIVHQVNDYCFITDLKLPFEKIEAQEMWPRHVPDNILDGEPRDYYCHIANQIFGSIRPTGEKRPNPKTQNVLPPPVQLSLPEPEPRDNFDDFFSTPKKEPVYVNPINHQPDDYENLVKAKYLETRHPGESFETWKIRRPKEVFEKVCKGIEDEKQTWAETVRGIDRDEPHLAEQVYNFDGSYCYTKYQKDGHKYVKFPDGRINQIF